MAIQKSYKPRVTQKLLELKKKLYDVIESVHCDDKGVYLQFKRGWSSMEGSHYITAPTAAELLRQFKFKKAGT